MMALSKDCSRFGTAVNQPSVKLDRTMVEDKRLTIEEAARELGVDSFTVFSLIQRGRVNPDRASSGEITVPASELAKLMEKGG